MTLTLELMALTAALIFGVGLTLYGALVAAPAVGMPRDGVFGARQILRLIRALRAILVGLSAVGLAVGLAGGHSSLVTLSLVFGLEELYETTMALSLLRRIERHERYHAERAAAGLDGGPLLPLAAA